MTVYLCGGMEGLTEQESKEWRETATFYLNGKCIEVLDPTRRKKFHDQKPSLNLSRKIVAKDLLDIDESRVILANLKDRGKGKAWGSICEVTYAWMKGKPIVLVLEKEFYHPFLETFVTEKYETLDEALESVASYYE